tara:strand:- start:5980 stop:6417 length:438 start_codon:yes stop_codon:yes gene_type:complete
MKTIAVAVDFDEEVRDVIDLAATMARYFGAEIHLIHIYVQHPELAPFMYPGGPIESEVEFQKETQQIEQLVEELREQGIRAAGYMKGGNAVSGLLEFAEHRNADLIVIGSHRKERVEDILGSVANGLVRRSTIPVLVVPRKKKAA